MTEHVLWMWHALGARPDLKNQLESSDMARRLYLSAKSWNHPMLQSIRNPSLFNHTWSERSLSCSNSFQTGFPFCFCVPALLAAVCARESASGLCSLQSIKGGGVEGLILWREKPHDRELIVQDKSKDAKGGHSIRDPIHNNTEHHSHHQV